MVEVSELWERYSDIMYALCYIKIMIEYWNLKYPVFNSLNYTHTLLLLLLQSIRRRDEVKEAKCRYAQFPTHLKYERIRAFGEQDF